MRWSLALGLAAFFVAAFFVAGSAEAQTRFDPQFFHPSTSQRSNPTGVWAADVLPDAAFELGVIAHYDSVPLVVRDAREERLYGVIAHQASLHVLGAVGLFDRLEIGVDIPIILSQGGDAIPRLPGFNLDASGAGAGVGDVRLTAKVQLFTTTSATSPAGAALALVVEGFFPTGDQSMFQGEDWRVAPRLVLDGITSDHHRISLSAGYTYRQQVEVAGLEVGPTFDWGFAANFATQYVHVVPEVRGSLVTTATHLDLQEIPMEVGLSLRVLPIEQLQIQASGGVGLFQGFGAPDYRLIFGVSWLQTPSTDRDGDGIPNSVDECPDVAEDIDTFEDANGCPDPDNDADGILDERDECPLEPEDIDQFEDANGCPDPDNDADGILDAPDECPNEAEDIDQFEDRDGCPDPDNDGDGILDAADECPRDPEDLDDFEDENGCPDPDNDHDGILDAADQCPLEPEDMNGIDDTDGCPEVDTDGDGLLDPRDRCPTVAEDPDGFEDDDGCPDPDNDHDGILDGVDRCPLVPEVVNGFEDEDGCPDESVIEVTCHAIVIRDSIFFETNRAVIQHRSFDLLDQIASVMGARPDIRRISVEGHTDSRGRDAHNLDLSSRRAESVRQYLVARGIAPERLVAQGFGELRPIEDNATADGRAANRRVEFVIVEQEGCQDETPSP